MSKTDPIPKPAENLAASYFQTLSEYFPVMCSSDEFDFLPRAQAACESFTLFENLDKGRITEICRRIKQYRHQFEQAGRRTDQFETMIDLEALAANAGAVLFELEEARNWQSNPLIYLKIAMIGLDQALHKPAATRDQKLHRSISRISGIPQLLRQAVANLVQVPAVYLEAAQAMIRDSCRYLSELQQQQADSSRNAFVREIPKAILSLQGFAEALGSVPIAVPGSAQGSALEQRTAKHFLCRRPVAEIYEIGGEEWRQSRVRLEELKNRIDPHQTWLSLYQRYQPDIPEGIDTFQLYGGEIQALEHFFGALRFPGMTGCAPLEVCQTPTYLRSVRSAASFSAACRGLDGEQDLFYITTRADEKRNRHDLTSLIKRLHREYRFLTAHETVPGHHLLDSIRRCLPNPVRRQLESPLFYEGWAYYAESLLLEYGYVDNPMEQLVDAKRRLWRAARCRIDVGVNTGRLSREQAMELLVQAGLNGNEAGRQVDRFRLNPGYQICYTLGRHEISALRTKYEPVLGRERFHRLLLTGGQLPFHLIERRLQARVHENGKTSGLEPTQWIPDRHRQRDPD